MTLVMDRLRAEQRLEAVLEGSTTKSAASSLSSQQRHVARELVIIRKKCFILLDEPLMQVPSHGFLQQPVAALCGNDV